MLLLPLGCGYRVLSGAAPFGAQRVVVVPFSEAEPIGISPAMAGHLTRLLAASGVELTTDIDRADARLSGKIHLTNTPSTALKTVQIYTAAINLHAELVASDGTRLWAGDVALKEDFLPTDPTEDIQPLVSETNRRTALRRLAERAATSVHGALMVASTLAHHEES